MKKINSAVVLSLAVIAGSIQGTAFAKPLDAATKTKLGEEACASAQQSYSHAKCNWVYLNTNESGINLYVVQLVEKNEARYFTLSIDQADAYPGRMLSPPPTNAESLFIAKNSSGSKNALEQ